MKKKRMITPYAIVAISLILLVSSLSPSLATPLTQQNSSCEEPLYKDFPQQVREENPVKTLFQPDDLISILEDLLTSTINTTLNSHEKTSSVIFGATNNINIDDDENTGINGEDISIRYLVLPTLSTSPDLQVGLRFSLSINRLNDDLKDEDFQLSAQMFDNTVEVGYNTTDELTNEIPESMELSISIFYNIGSGTLGLSIGSNPTYATSAQDKSLNIYGTYNKEPMKRTLAYSLTPAVGTQATISSTPSQDRWAYEFSRDASTIEPTLSMKLSTITDAENKETTVSLNPLPESISFELTTQPFQTTGGSIIYQSQSSYDVDMLITTEQFNNAKYVQISTLPESFSAQWLPTQTDGYLHLDVSSTGSVLTITDDLTNPDIEMSLSQIDDLNITTTWNLTNPGILTIDKNPSLSIDLYLKMQDWTATLEAQPTAEKIDVGWNINSSDGYIQLDTDWEQLSTIDLLIEGPNLGLNTEASTFKAQDFQINWTIWPPSEFNLDYTGYLFFLSLSIDISINGNWYHIWPWV